VYVYVRARARARAHVRAHVRAREHIFNTRVQSLGKLQDRAGFVA